MSVHSIAQMIPLDGIEIAENVRTVTGLDKASINELAESLKTHGLMQPIYVARGGDKFVVIAGQRRTLAAIEAGWTEIAAIISEDEGGEERKAKQIVENLHRENLSLSETCGAVREMLAMVGKPAEVQRRLNKSAAWVSKHLSVTGPNFSAKVRELVTSGGCNDIETALMINQIAKHKGAGESLAEILSMKVSKGLIGRAGVRAELDKLRTPAEDAGKEEDGDGEGERNSDAQTGKKTISFELSDMQAALFAALGGVAWIKRELKKAEKAKGELPA
jgi:ParB/RepB/Spo0J family partition protein